MEGSRKSGDLSFSSPWKGPRCRACRSPPLGLCTQLCSSLHVAMLEGSKVPSDPATPAYPPRTSSGGPPSRGMDLYPFSPAASHLGGASGTAFSSPLVGSSPESCWFDVLQPLTPCIHFCPSSQLSPSAPAFVPHLQHPSSPPPLTLPSWSVL